MRSVKKAVILAAGNGRRLASISGGLPKPLVQLNGKPLLEHVLLGAQQAGIEEFVIVLGYCGEAIHSYFAGDPRFDITWLHNPDYHKDNGVSLLAARESMNEPFLLLMADHLFEPETAAALLRQSIGPDEVLLAVDEKIESVFDIDDATKVVRLGNYIFDIGKKIRCYDAVDTGMFLCSPIIFYWLESVKQNGNCSLSDGMRAMARNRKLRAFAIGDALWQDVDDPEMFDHAQAIFDNPICPTTRELEMTSV
jgi:choline kinase